MRRGPETQIISQNDGLDSRRAQAPLGDPNGTLYQNGLADQHEALARQYPDGRGNGWQERSLYRSETERRRRLSLPSLVRKAGTLGVIGCVAFTAYDIAHNVFGFDFGAGKVLPHHSAQAWSLERSLQRMYSPNQTIVRAGDGRDIYKVHTSWGNNVPLVGGLADDAFGKDYVAGMTGELQLVLSNTYGKHQTPSYNWQTSWTTKPAPTQKNPNATKKVENVTFYVNDAALGWQVAKVDCLVEPGTQNCYGNISKTTFDSAAPFIEGGLSVVPGLGLLARGLSVIGVSVISNLIEQNGQDGSREIATYQAASQDFGEGCAGQLDKTAAVESGLLKDFRTFVSANSLLAAKDGQSGKADTLAKAVNNVHVELLNPNGSPVKTQYVPIAPPPGPSKTILAQRMGVSTGRLTMPKNNPPCTTTTTLKNADPTADNINAISKTYTKQVGNSVDKLLAPLKK